MHEVNLLHSDDWMLVLDKPAGLLCVPGRGGDKQDCLSARAQRQFADALIVHRLDMATSGLVLMARGPAMQRALSMAFAERRVEKRYVAVVAGILEQDSGEIVLPLGADWPNRPRQVVDHANGKESRTLWHVLSRDVPGQRTRLELEPITGRSHQLRVHLNAIGHPILGDPLYGPAAARDATPRLLLNASALALVHPASSERVSFVSAPPF